MIPRVLTLLALIALFVGVAVSVYRLVSRTIEKRRIAHEASKKSAGQEKMGDAEVAFRAGEFAKKFRRVAVAGFASGLVMTFLGAYGVYELVRHLLSIQAGGPGIDGFTMVLFVAPFVAGYGVYLSVSNAREIRKIR